MYESQDTGSAPDKTVFLHVGAPKTGSTFLQNVLWRNRHELAANGVYYPLEWPMQHLHAALDLRQQRRGPRWTGVWDHVAERIRTWEGPTVVFSNEQLGGAKEAHVRRAVDALQPAEIHVVFTARDLARQLASDWQEELKHRHSVTFRRFVDDLIELGIDAPRPFGEMFWGLHDAVRVLGTWSKVIPVSRIHVVTVPQSGGPKGLLWERFAGLIGADPGRYDTVGATPNTSLGAVEANVVRSLNAALDGDLDWPLYDEFVKQHLAQNVLSTRPEPIKITLPEDQHTWSIGRSKELIDGLRAGGYDIIGDLEELLPTPSPDPDGCSVPEDLPAEPQRAAAIEALAAVLRRMEPRHQSQRKLSDRVQELERLLEERRRRPIRSMARDISERRAGIMRLRAAWWHAMQRGRRLRGRG